MPQEAMVLYASLAYQATPLSCIGGSWGLLHPTPKLPVSKGIWSSWLD